MNLVYRASRVLLRTAIKAYYRVSVVNPDRLPARGPVIFASNHPSSLLDPVVIGACLDRQLHFVAKSTLFRGPFGSFLKLAGAIPVYRRQDQADTSLNVRTFQSCFEALEHGRAICIFPEGLSHTDPQLKQLKTGAARIALEAEERNEWKLRVLVVPVGLSFQRAPRFRSRVTINVGDPLDPTALQTEYDADPKAATLELTSRLEKCLERLIVHIDRLELAGVVRAVERIYLRDVTGPTPDPAARLAAAQEIARAVHLFMSRSPDESSRLARRIERYLRLLERLGIRDELIRRRSRDVKLSRESARLLLLGSLLLPVALYGLVTNYVPIRAAFWSGRLLAPRKSVVATARVLAGVVAVLLTYPLEIYLAWGRWGMEGAALFGASLPLAGYIAVLYPRWFSTYVDGLRSALLRKTRRRSVSRLRRHRATLVAELDRLRAEYVLLRDQSEAPSA